MSRTNSPNRNRHTYSTSDRDSNYSKSGSENRRYESNQRKYNDSDRGGDRIYSRRENDRDDNRDYDRDYDKGYGKEKYRDRRNNGRYRERDRSRSRDRDYDIDRNRYRESSQDRKEREREETLKNVGFGSRAAVLAKKKEEDTLAQILQFDPKIIEELGEEEVLKTLGMPTSFGSTKNKKVEGANVAYAFVVKKREFRQYMNRKGGFNRLLDNKQ